MLPDAGDAAPVSAPTGAEEEKLFLVPGERLTFRPGAPEFPVAVEAPSRKAHWIAEAEVDEVGAGFENIGRITALNFRGVVYMLAKVEQGAGGRCRYLFAPWPLNEAIRAECRYPEDELARLADEKLKRHQEGFSLARLLLLPLVGGLPARWQEWTAEKLRLNFYGASKVNAFLTGAVGLNLIILVYIVGSFTAFYAVQRAVGIPFAEPLSLYLFADGAYRAWHTWEFAAESRRRETDEIGWLALEALDWAIQRVREKLS